jgi:hypothetical protein
MLCRDALLRRSAVVGDPPRVPPAVRLSCEPHSNDLAEGTGLISPQPDWRVVAVRPDDRNPTVMPTTPLAHWRGELPACCSGEQVGHVVALGLELLGGDPDPLGGELVVVQSLDHGPAAGSVGSDGEPELQAAGHAVLAVGDHR